jgi:hypothetical protein
VKPQPDVTLAQLADAALASGRAPTIVDVCRNADAELTRLRTALAETREALGQLEERAVIVNLRGNHDPELNRLVFAARAILAKHAGLVP